MSLIRPPHCLTLFAIFALALSTNVFAGNRYIDEYDDSKNSKAAAVAANPILEILHAWVGVDDPEDWSPASYRTMTQNFSSMLLRNGQIDIRHDGIHESLWGGEKNFAPGKHKSYGIVYRDNTGAHFRRYAWKSGCSLPAITAHSSIHNGRSEKGYFTSFQLEETDRGLVTYTCKTPNENIISFSDLQYCGRHH